MIRQIEPGAINNVTGFIKFDFFTNYLSQNMALTLCEDRYKIRALCRIVKIWQTLWLAARLCVRRVILGGSKAGPNGTIDDVFHICELSSVNCQLSYCLINCSTRLSPTL